MSDVDLHLLTGAYAIDALDDVERRAFERHLAGCAPCRDEVAELRATAALLGHASSEAPPAGLRDRTLAAVSRTPQSPPASVAFAPGGRRKRWTMAAAGLAAAAAVVVTLGTGVYGIQQGQRADELVARADAVAAVLSAPDARTVKANSDALRATVVVSASTDSAAFIGDGLAPTSGDEVYQLWVISGGGTIAAAGIVEPTEAGRGAVVLDAEVDEGSTVAITVEPGPGAAAPSTDPLVAVQV